MAEHGTPVQSELPQQAAQSGAAPNAPSVTSAADPLAGLRDIHLPASPTWWPPAPGWWLLLALCVAALAILWHGWRRLRRARAPWRAACAALADLRRRAAAGELAERELANELSATLRRYALLRWPRAQVAGLTDERWRNFLAHTGAPAFAGPSGAALAAARHARPPAPDALARGPDATALEAILDAADEWLAANRPRRNHRAADLSKDDGLMSDAAGPRGIDMTSTLAGPATAPASPRLEHSSLNT